MQFDISQDLYSFAEIFRQYFSFEYIYTFIHEHTSFPNIFGHSFVKI